MDPDIHRHGSYEQVKLDVNRCAARRKNKRKKLIRLIVRLLITRPEIHYYQGFHDVCLTFMELYGPREAFERLNKLVDTHFRVFLQPTMNETIEFLAMIPVIIGLRDKRLQNFLEQAEVGTIFALSWTITWFSHVLLDNSDIESIFKYLEQFEDHHLILYLCAEVVSSDRNAILKLEQDMSTIHHHLCSIPKSGLSVSGLLKEATQAFETWPPEFIKEEISKQKNAQISPSSSLGPSSSLTSLVRSKSRFAVVVFVLASAFMLHYHEKLWNR